MKKVVAPLLATLLLFGAQPYAAAVEQAVADTSSTLVGSRAASLYGLLPTAKAKPKWSLTEDAVDLGLRGVSPHVTKPPLGDRLWRSDAVPTGTGASLCDATGSCVQESFTTGAVGPVSDYTIAKAPSGWRAYFKKVDGATQGVYSAPCTTVDCLSFGTPTLTSSEMVVSRETRAWGVPDPVKLPDGRIRIYIVESPVSGGCTEKVASYISADGITFKKEKGWRLSGGFVDTEVLRAKNGNWVMIVADGPGCGSDKGSQKPQQLFTTTSLNGLKWTTPKALTGTDVGRLDPTGYEVSKNVFRIYYASGSITDNNYTIERATLRFK
jgi:hypothetical protein